MQPWVLALQPPKPQVLIVPGFMGTKLLTKDGGAVWLSDQTIQLSTLYPQLGVPFLNDANAWNTLGVIAFNSYNAPLTRACSH